MNTPAGRGLGLDPETLENAPSFQPGTAEEERTRRRQAMWLQEEVQLSKVLRRADALRGASPPKSSTEYSDASASKGKSKDVRERVAEATDRPLLRSLGQSHGKPLPETVKCTVTPVDWTYPNSLPLLSVASSVASAATANHPPSKALSLTSLTEHGRRDVNGSSSSCIPSVQTSTERTVSSATKSFTCPTSSTSKTSPKLSSSPSHTSSGLSTTPKFDKAHKSPHSDECSIVAASIRATENVVDVLSSSVAMYSSSQNKSRKVTVEEIRATTAKVERAINTLKDMSRKMKARQDFTCEDARRAIAEKDRLKALAAASKEAQSSKIVTSEGASPSPKLVTLDVSKSTTTKSASPRSESVALADIKKPTMSSVSEASLHDRSKPERSPERIRIPTAANHSKATPGAKEPPPAKPTTTRSHTVAAPVGELTSPSVSKANRAAHVAVSEKSSEGTRHDAAATSSDAVTNSPASSSSQDLSRPKATRAPDHRAPRVAAMAGKPSPLARTAALPSSDVLAPVSTATDAIVLVPDRTPQCTAISATSLSTSKDRRCVSADLTQSTPHQPMKIARADHKNKNSRPSTAESTRSIRDKEGPHAKTDRALSKAETNRKPMATSDDSKSPKRPVNEPTRASKVVEKGVPSSNTSLPDNNPPPSSRRDDIPAMLSLKGSDASKSSTSSTPSAETIVESSRAESTTAVINFKGRHSGDSPLRVAREGRIDVLKSKAPASDQGRIDVRDLELGLKSPSRSSRAVDVSKGTSPSDSRATALKSSHVSISPVGRVESTSIRPEPIQLDASARPVSTAVTTATTSVRADFSTQPGTPAFTRKGEKVRTLAAFTSKVDAAKSSDSTITEKTVPCLQDSRGDVGKTSDLDTRSSSTSSRSSKAPASPTDRSSLLSYMTIPQNCDSGARGSSRVTQSSLSSPAIEEETLTRFNSMFAESIVGSSVASPLSEDFPHTAPFNFGRERLLPGVPSRTSSIAGARQNTTVQEVSAAKPHFVLPSPRRIRETTALHASVSHWRNASVDSVLADPTLMDCVVDVQVTASSSEESIPSTSKLTSNRGARFDVTFPNASVSTISTTRTTSTESDVKMLPFGLPEATRISRGIEVPVDSPPRYSTVARGRARAHSDVTDRKVRVSRSMNWLTRPILQEYTATSAARSDFYKEAIGWRSNPTLTVQAPPRKPTPQDELLSALAQERHAREERARRGNVFQRALKGLGLRKKPEDDDNIMYRTWNGPSNITWKKP